MAETDPKKIRPFGQPSERQGEEDPLVELARIVSEDSGFYAPRGERQKPAREEPVDRNALSADLETELLQELESSFTARSAPRAGAPAARAPAPVQQSAASLPARDDSDDLLRSIERQLGEFERRAQRPAAAVPAPARQAPPARPAKPAPSEREPASQAYSADGHSVAPQPPEEPPARRTDPERALAEARERIARLRPTEQRERVAQPPPARETPARPQPQRVVSQPRPDPLAQTRPDLRGSRPPNPAPDQQPDRTDDPRAAMRLPLRRRDAPTPRHDDDSRPGPRTAFAAGAAGGWDEPEHDQPAGRVSDEGDWRSPNPDYGNELRTTFGAMDETPLSGRAHTEPVEANLPGELEAGYSDPTYGGDWREPDYDADDSAHLSPGANLTSPDVRQRQPEPRRSRAGLIAAASVLGVVALGAAALFLMQSGEDVPAGPPPVIAAPEGETKVAAPATEQAAGETVGEAVYNRVAGNEPAAEEQVVDGAEEPREISRIVLPPPATAADGAAPLAAEPDPAVAAASGAAPAESAVTAQPIGPRRVRTYVVRPDGSIDETAAPPVGEGTAPPPAVEQEVAALDQPEPEPMVPVRVPTTEIDGTGQPQAIQPDSSAAAAQSAAAEPAPEPPPAAQAEPVLPPTQAAPTEPAVQAAPAAVASAPAPAPAAAAGEGYVVQISSQRSMDDAQSSWASMQRRYPSVLGDMQPNIQEADLGERGTYYRVRVGPWASRAEAVQMCEALRSAGGDCIVTR